MSSVPAPRAAPIIPFVSRIYQPVERYAYTLIRVTAGAMFIPHGVQKLFFGGATGTMGYAIGAVELLAGLAVVLGILVRPMVALLIVNVLMIIVANIGVTPGFSSIYTTNSAQHTAVVQVNLKEGHDTGSFEYMDRIRRRIASELPHLTTYFQSGGLVDAVLNLGLPARSLSPSSVSTPG